MSAAERQEGVQVYKLWCINYERNITVCLKSAEVHPLTNNTLKLVLETCIKDGHIPPFMNYRSQATSMDKLDV